MSPSNVNDRILGRIEAIGPGATVNVNKSSAFAVSTLLCAALVTSAPAQQPSKEEIAARLNNVSAEDISESPLPGVYQVQVGSRVFDGSLAGELDRLSKEIEIEQG